jgi:hypothetical protein
VRFVFLALLVANIAFFAWARWIDVAASAPASAAHDASIPPLQLADKPSTATTTAPALTAPATAISATSPAPSPGTASGGAGSPAQPINTPPAVTASSTPAASTAVRCRSLGPFEDANAANVVADRLRSRGFSPRDRNAETTNPNVYWVYIGELTVEMQRRAIQTLNAAGIRDAAAMTQPEQSDRVSVGVFADQAHAVRRAEQVRALGLKPTLGLRQRNVSAHWLDFDVKSSETEPRTAELLGVAPRPGIALGPVKMTDCPAISGNG